jgi:hypothetical protein
MWEKNTKKNNILVGTKHKYEKLFPPTCKRY